MNWLAGADSAGFFARFALGLVAAAIIALAGLRLRALTRSGAIAAIVVGAAVYGGAGPACAAALIAFFATGSVLSRAGSGEADGRRSREMGATRDARQVLANGGAAAFCAIASATFRWLGAPHAAEAMAIAAIVSIAGVAGDTWASEIGSRLGGRPRLITTFAVAQPRTSGAVTWVGSIAAAAGGAVVGLSAALFGFGGTALTAAVIGAAAGLVGSTIDSVLGASVQAVWHCKACDGPSDVSLHSCGAATTHVRGYVGVDNDAVNALTAVSLAGLSVVASLLY